MVFSSGRWKLCWMVFVLSFSVSFLSEVSAFAVATAASGASTRSAAGSSVTRSPCADTTELRWDARSGHELLLAQKSVDAGPRVVATETGRTAQKQGSVQKPGATSITTKKSGKTTASSGRGKATSAQDVEQMSASQRSGEIAGPRLSILVIGDSLAVGVGMTLNSAFEARRRVTIRAMGKQSTGLDSPAYYSWHNSLKEMLNREHFDLVVVALGANDAHNGPGTQAWGRLYESKYAELLRIPTDRGTRTLVLGLPPMRKPDFSQRVKTTNEAIRNATRRFPENCVYVDAFDRFSDDGGNFTNRIRMNGEWKNVRAEDGVHFTGTGYLVLSRMVADEALARFKW